MPNNCTALHIDVESFGARDHRETDCKRTVEPMESSNKLVWMVVIRLTSDNFDRRHWFGSDECPAEC